MLASVTSGSMPPIGPLGGIKVLEAGGRDAAYAGLLLAELGADVVRLTARGTDNFSTDPPFAGESQESIDGLVYNACKRLVELPSVAEAVEAFVNLANEADLAIVSRNAFDGALLGRLTSCNRLTRVVIHPFGHEGPWSPFKSSELVSNALSGAASVTGNAETPPLNGHGNQAAHTVGMYAAIVGLAAWRIARAGLNPPLVDLNAHEALVSCTEQVLMQWFFPENGPWQSPVAQRQGSLHWTRAYEVYPARDGRGVMVSVALKLYESLRPWLIEAGAAHEFADDATYPSALEMVREMPRLMEVMREWVATSDSEEFFFEAQRRHQPFGVVWNVPRALESPQIAARAYFQSAEIEGGQVVPVPGRLFRTDVDEGHPTPARSVTPESVGWSRRQQAPPRALRPPPTAERPLEGVRILDFTHVLAGPFGTRVLGDLGAEVLKVGTSARGGGANSAGHPYYVSWNRNKQSLTIDMRSPQGQKVARDLAGVSDVIIENFSAGVLARWGLDRAGLAEEYPGVSVVSMGGMGQTGPWKDFVTFAPTIHALTGLTHLTNPPGRHDLGYGFSLTDHLSGLAGALACVAAVEHRDRTGQGISVDLSQYEVGLHILRGTYLDYLINGNVPEPVGNRHPHGHFAPQGVYPCSGDDRWIAISIDGDEQFRRLVTALGEPGLASRDEFATHEARLANHNALDKVISRCTRDHDRYQLMAALQQLGIAAGAVQDAEDLATRDPQLARGQFFGTANSPRWGDYGVDRFPARFNGVRPPTYEGVHEAGQDTFDVLTRVLQYDDAYIAELVASGALT